MANTSIRGAEAQVLVSVQGQQQQGTYQRVQSFTITINDEIVKEQYLGESTSELDYQYDDVDFEFTAHLVTDDVLRYVVQQAERYEDRQPPLNVTVTILFGFRDPQTSATAVVMSGGVLRVPSIETGGRKEYVSARFEGSAKKIRLIRQ